MPRARRVCSVIGCPELTDTGRCQTHRREADQARGTRQARGYDAQHTKARALAILDSTPATPCARCGQPLGPAYRSAHYDHTDDRRGYLGLSHPTCNAKAGGQASHRQTLLADPEE